MSQVLNPFSGRQFIDANGDPYSGAQLFIYSAGSSTKVTTTKDLAGASNHANPIILNSKGEPADGAGAAQAIWQTAGVTVKLVLAPSTDTDPPIAAIESWDNIAGINDTTVTIDEWVAGPTPTFIDTTNFSLVGDQTSDFHVGRRLKFSETAGTVYGTITASAYTSLTTVTVALDSGTLDSGLSAVWYGLLSETNHAIPFGAMFTAIGDILYGSAVSIASRLGIGSAGSVLTTDGSTPSWATQGNPGQAYEVSTDQTGLTARVHKDWIAGFIPTIGTDTDHDIDITAGEAADSGNTTKMIGGAMTKQIDATWATGTDAGLMATVTTQTGTYSTTGTAVSGTGSSFDTEFAVGDILYSATETIGRRITVVTDATNMTIESAFPSDVSGDNVQKNGLAPDTTYYIHAIQQTASPFAIDYYADNSITAANIVSGYTKYRNVAQFKTDTTDPPNLVSGLIRRAGASRDLISQDFGTESGLKILIEKRSVSSAISANEFSWTAGLYSEIVIRIDNWLIETTAGGDGEPRLQLSTDAGSTYITSNYASTGSATTTYVPLANDDLIEITTSGTDNGFSGDIRLHGIDDTTYHKKVTFDSYYYSDAGTFLSAAAKAHNTTASEITGFKLYFDGAAARNTEFATITVWGITK